MAVSLPPTFITKFPNKSYFLLLISVLAIASVYTFLLYVTLKGHYPIDFTSFYYAEHALYAGNNPYQVLHTVNFEKSHALSANLNPPVLLWLLMPLSYLPYSQALIIWTLVSLFLGILGAKITFQLCFSSTFLAKYWPILYLIFLASLPVIHNIAIGQIGFLLFFMVMWGYHFYEKRKDWEAGIIWGIIISIKLFPGLILIFCLSQKRYRVTCIAIASCIILACIPYFYYGFELYVHYWSMLSHVLWYGDNWNASLYGFIFRIFISQDPRLVSLTNLNLLQYFAVFCAFLGFVWTTIRLYQVEKQDMRHKGFCITLVMMLFLSPLGWSYYFMLLLLPYLESWFSAIQSRSTATKLCWLTSFFFINFGSKYVEARHMDFFLDKLGFYSLHFYGLVLLIYVVSQSHYTQARNIKEQSMVPSLYIILGIGLLVRASNLVEYYL